MKKIATIAALLCLSATAAAQDWKEALKKAATEAADKAADGKLTQYALAGTWKYTGPGVKFEGDDLTALLGAGTLETAVAGQLEKAYAQAGLRPGTGSVTFERQDSTFTATGGGHTLAGTYAFDAEAHRVTLRFAKGKYDLGTIGGRVYLSGSQLVLVFPVARLAKLVEALDNRVAAFRTVAALLAGYENLYVGFAFSK